ncbi:hypothetical protein ACFL0T_01860 [Candidatus Omnitrophota bacterium]
MSTFLAMQAVREEIIKGAAEKGKKVPGEEGWIWPDGFFGQGSSFPTKSSSAGSPSNAGTLRNKLPVSRKLLLEIQTAV